MQGVDGTPVVVLLLLLLLPLQRMMLLVASPHSPGWNDGLEYDWEAPVKAKQEPICSCHGHGRVRKQLRPAKQRSVTSQSDIVGP